jgi:outer membrane lipoprotein carrier protein
MNSMSRSLVLLLLGAAVLLPAAAPPDSLISNVEQHYNNAHTLSVEFVEEYSTQGHARPAESGKLTLRKQGKMRWDYDKPAGKVFVSDGKTVYLYMAADNRVEKVPLKDTEDMRAPLAFLLGHLDMKKEFRDITVTPDNGSRWWLNAKARNEQTPFSEIQMLVDSGGLVSRLKVVGRDASQLNFAFSHEQMNPAAGEALFHFTIPPGAEVVNAAEYTGQDH